MSSQEKLTRVAVLSQLAPPVNGSTMMTQLLLNSLDASGFVCEFINRRFSSTGTQVGVSSLRKILIAPGLWGRTFRALVKRPDVFVFFATTRGPSFLSDYVISLIARSLRTRIILYCHTQGFTQLSRQNPVAGFLVRDFLRHSSCVVTLSGELAADIRPFVSDERVMVIPNTVQEFAKSSPPAVRGPYVLFFAHLSRNKGAHTFIDAASQLCETLPTLRFIAAGSSVDEGYMEELVEKVSQSNLGTRFQFIGEVRGEDKWSLLQGAELLFYPTTYDAQPLVILEAMAMGTPVVASDVGAIGSMVTNGITGFVISDSSQSDFVESSLKILTSRTLRRSMSVSARKSFVENYSPKSFNQRWVDLISHIIRAEAQAELNKHSSRVAPKCI
jgi:glycosyltransferase involved in cell wall biosynthesis